MSNLTIISWCPGDPCDPCAKCLGTLVASVFDDPTVRTSATYISGSSLTCNPAFLLLKVSGEPIAERLDNPYYAPGDTVTDAARAFAAQANSLTGAWTGSAAFEGNPVFGFTGDMHYINNADPLAGPWQLVLNDTYSPDPRDISFNSGGVIVTVNGWPWPGPIDPVVQPPPYTWRWQINGSFQQIDAQPVPIGPSIYNVDQAFRIPPDFYHLQAAILRRSKMGHRLPLVRRFQGY